MFLDQDPTEFALIYWNPRFPQEQRLIPYNKESFLEDKVFLQERIREIKKLAYSDFEAVNDDSICLIVSTGLSVLTKGRYWWKWKKMTWNWTWIGKY